MPLDHPEPRSSPGRKYTWPWFVLAAFLLGLLLAGLWMTKEIQRAKRIRDANAPTALQPAAAPDKPR